MSAGRPRITATDNPGDALAELCEGFFADGDGLGEFETVQPEAMPESYRQLLVHTDHMTTQLEAYHGGPMELGVLEYRHQDDIYTRKILLTLAGTDRVVEFGIVRLDLRHTPDAVREKIISRSVPLGAILIEHDLLRRIEPKWYLRFAGPYPQCEYFDSDAAAPVFGRIGLIHCDGKPAIELLEIVSDRREAAEG